MTLRRKPFALQGLTLSIGTTRPRRDRSVLLLATPALMGCYLEAIGFNSTVRIPAKIKAAPAKPTFVTPSFPKVTAVARANTGSNAKISAVRVELVYCWPHV